MLYVQHIVYGGGFVCLCLEEGLLVLPGYAHDTLLSLARCDFCCMCSFGVSCSCCNYLSFVVWVGYCPYHLDTATIRPRGRQFVSFRNLGSGVYALVLVVGSCVLCISGSGGSMQIFCMDGLVVGRIL